MAFPQIRSIGTYESSIIFSSHTCNYPASVEAGDLLIFLLSNDGTDDIPTVDSTSVPGVAHLVSDGHPTPYNHGHAIAWVEADGTEGGGTFTCNITSGEEFVCACIAISGWDGVTAPEISTDTVGSSSSPDAVSLTASWGAEDNLWISFVSYNLSLGTITYPSNYSSNQNELNSNGGVNGCAFATRELNAATEDVGAWSGTSSTGWGAFTIAVRPEGGSGQTINRVLTENTVVTDPVPGYILSQERPANSNINVLTDVAFLYYAFARLVVDNFDLYDTYVIEQNLRRNLSNTASLEDVIRLLRQSFREVADSIAITDALTKSVTVGLGTTYSKVRADNLRVTDSYDAVFLGTVDKEIADTISLGEAEFLSRFSNRALPEQIAILSDLMNMVRGKVTLDRLRTTDAVSINRLRTYNVSMFDTFALTDSFERDLQYVKRKRLTDILALTDSRSFEQGSTLQPSVRIETGIQER